MLKKGDKVIATELFAKNFPTIHNRFKRKGCSYVTGMVSKDEYIIRGTIFKAVNVLVDGNKAPKRYSINYWRKLVKISLGNQLPD
jgi:precorrin-6B methylase 2